MNEYKFTDRNKKQCGYMRIVDEADLLHSLDGKKSRFRTVFSETVSYFFTSIYSNQHQVPYLSVPLLSGVGV